MNDAEKILADAAGYTPQEIEAKFHITETEKEWTVKAIDWLDGPTRNRLVKAFSEKGGGYSKDQNTKRAIFTLPNGREPIHKLLIKNLGMKSQPNHQILRAMGIMRLAEA